MLTKEQIDKEIEECKRLDKCTICKGSGKLHVGLIRATEEEGLKEVAAVGIRCTMCDGDGKYYGGSFK